MRDSGSKRIARQCSDDEGCLYSDLVGSKNVLDTSTFKLCDPELNSRELDNKKVCLLSLKDKKGTNLEFNMTL